MRCILTVDGPSQAVAARAVQVSALNLEHDWHIMLVVIQIAMLLLPEATLLCTG